MSVRYYIGTHIHRSEISDGTLSMVSCSTKGRFLPRGLRAARMKEDLIVCAQGLEHSLE
jgi:hypothetical protein